MGRKGVLWGWIAGTLPQRGRSSYGCLSLDGLIAVRHEVNMITGSSAGFRQPARQTGVRARARKEQHAAAETRWGSLDLREA